VAAFRSDELRNEGEEEEGGFGVEGFGEDALAESRCGGWTEGRWVGCADCDARALGFQSGVDGWRIVFCCGLLRQGDVTRPDHFYAEEDEVGCAGVLDGVEGDGGGGEDGGDSESGGEDVEESAEESAEGGLKTLAAASGEGAGEDVEDAGAGSDGEKESGGEEECETVRVEHGKESIRYKVQSAR